MAFGDSNILYPIDHRLTKVKSLVKAFKIKSFYMYMEVIKFDLRARALAQTTIFEYINNYKKFTWVNFMTKLKKTVKRIYFVVNAIKFPKVYVKIFNAFIQF